MQEFLISVASGLVVAIFSALFLSKRGRGGGGQSQSMTINNGGGGGFTRTLIAFLVGALLVFAALQLAPGLLAAR